MWIVAKVIGSIFIIFGIINFLNIVFEIQMFTIKFMGDTSSFIVNSAITNFVFGIVSLLIGYLILYREHKKSS